MVYFEKSPVRMTKACSLNYCYILYDLEVLVLSRRKKCSKFQFCKFSLAHKSQGELILALTMLKIKIAGHLPLLGYLSVTPLKPVEIAGYLPFIDSALPYRICGRADVRRKGMLLFPSLLWFCRINRIKATKRFFLLKQTEDGTRRGN